MKLKFSHTSPKTRVPLVPFVPWAEKLDRTRVLTGQVLLMFKKTHLSRLSHTLSHPLQRDKWDKPGTNQNKLLVPFFIAVKPCVFKGLEATGQMGHVGQAKNHDLKRAQKLFVSFFINRVQELCFRSYALSVTTCSIFSITCASLCPRSKNTSETQRGAAFHRGTHQ
jgi:hypothetical protein